MNKRIQNVGKRVIDNAMQGDVHAIIFSILKFVGGFVGGFIAGILLFSFIVFPAINHFFGTSVGWIG